MMTEYKSIGISPDNLGVLLTELGFLISFKCLVVNIKERETHRTCRLCG